MTKIKPEWVEAGAEALVGGTNYVMSGDNGVAGTMNRLTAEFVIAAVEPLIRAQIAAEIEDGCVHGRDTLIQPSGASCYRCQHAAYIARNGVQ